MRRELGETITHIVDDTGLLQAQAEEVGQETFLPDLQKIHSVAKHLLELVHELLGTAASQWVDVDFPRLRFEIRTALNHTVGYIEMLQERAYDLDQRGFLPALDKVHAACRRLLAQVVAAAPPASADSFPTDGRPGKSGTTKVEETARIAGTLLVVDDNLQNRDLLGRQLRSLGYRVVHAGSGPSAMERLRVEDFDLVLLDVVMPGMNGYEVLQWLKADARLRPIPVIMISAMNDTENVVRCLVIGADDYVVKPFDPILLKARISSSLERGRWRKQEATYLRQIEEEQAVSERLMLNIFPKSVVERLRQGEVTIADHLPDVTVLFADLVSFTPHTASMPAVEMVRLCNDICTAFDLLAEQRQVEKIRTFGNTYLAVGGLHSPPGDRAGAVAEFALGMQREMEYFRAATQRPLHLRIGIHTGPAIGGIIGRHKFSYDLWGETVSIARLLESRGEPDRIQVSSTTHALLHERYRFQERREVETHGAAPLITHDLLGNAG